MTDEEWNELDGFLRSILPFMRPQRYAEAVDRLRARLGTETRTEARIYLLAELSIAFMVGGEDDEALSAVRQCIDIDPDDPYNWCHLAHWYSLEKEPGDAALQSALDAIDTAVAKARKHGGDLRYCLNDRARIAVAMKRYDLVEDTLRQILETRSLPGIQFEGDFLGRIPEGAINPDLLATYKTLLAEQEAQRTRRRASPAGEAEH